MPQTSCSGHEVARHHGPPATDRQAVGPRLLAPHGPLLLLRLPLLPPSCCLLVAHFLLHPSCCPAPAARPVSLSLTHTDRPIARSRDIIPPPPPAYLKHT